MLTLLRSAPAWLALAWGCQPVDDEGAVQSADLTSRPLLDGTVSATGAVERDSAQLEFGVDEAGTEVRAFLTFDFGSLLNEDQAEGATLVIHKASLNVFQQDASDQPFQSLGAALVEVVDFGDGLQAEAFAVDAYSDPVTLATSSNDRAFHFANVTESLARWTQGSQDVQRVQLRIRFESSGPAGQWSLNAAEATEPAGAKPTLSLLYRILED